MEKALENASVRRVRAALKDLGAVGEVVALSDTARTAQDAAAAIGCPLGAIAKSLVFVVDGHPVMALIAGDRRCAATALAEALGTPGAKVKRADADVVRAATGFTIGGVAPVAHAEALPVVIDGSLARFDTIYAAAGHPHCVFPTTLAELVRVTPGVVSETVGEEA